jgi:hypothetical protein
VDEKKLESPGGRNLLDMANTMTLLGEALPTHLQESLLQVLHLDD